LELIIVSGLSGSGKSIALETLEDSGYYCIDNLPINLFEPFIQGAKQEAEAGQIYRKVAISIDARSRCESLQQFPDTLELATQMGISCQVMFLKAGEESLLKRFSETRRKHPLTDRSRSLTEAITLESALLVPIASRADLVIDTSHTNIHQLRDLIRERIGAKRDHRMSVYCLSFGYKNGIPFDADFTFDARCLPNPHWVPALRPKTGRDPEVSAFLENMPEVRRYLDDMAHFMQTWAPRFASENRSYLTIAVGCTGGQHRSVYLAEALAARLDSEEYDLLVRHRDLR
jgi:UPF0042 nucleotide-binding protein